MEDEECVPENSSLKLYLQNLGFSDFQITKNVTLNQSNLKFEISSPKPKTLQVETIDEEIIDQIGILISTQMLFEEDISNIERMLSSFKVVKNGMIKFMFQGIFGVVIIFVGLCLYWIIGCYAFIMVSSFYAYKAAYYLKRRHFNQARLKKLTMILQANFLLLKKAIKFIEENNKLIESHSESTKYKTEDLSEEFDYFNNFKSDFLMSVNEMICIFMKSTQKLIVAVPLLDYMETPECYLCNNFNSTNESTDFLKLYQIYLLMQSEFLQRLSLSLIPNIKLSAKDDNNNNFKELNCILTEACVKLLKIKNKLNKKFKFIFLNGIQNSNTKLLFKLPPKTQSSGINYKEEFMSNIHETSNTFQNLLIKSRFLENSITCEKIPENVEDELVNMQNELNSCQRNIADSFILLKKANAIKDKPEVVKLNEESHEPEEKLDKIFVGFTDLDPKIEDEIFEAYFTDEILNRDLSNIDDWDFDDRFKKKLEKEYSKSVIKELKIKLVEKAKNWEKREAELLRKKGIIKENEEVKKDSDEESVGGADCEEEKLKRKINEIQENFTDTIVKHLSENEDEAIGDTNYSFDDCSQNCLQGFNKSFLSDLGVARQRILKNSVEEEFYCDSGENSSEED